MPTVQSVFLHNLGADFRSLSSNKIVNESIAVGAAAPGVPPVEVGKTWLWLSTTEMRVTHWWNTATAAWLLIPAPMTKAVLYAKSYSYNADSLIRFGWISGNGEGGSKNKTESNAVFDGWRSYIGAPSGSARQLKYVIAYANFGGDTSATGKSFILSVPGNFPLEVAWQINKALNREVVFFDGFGFVFGFDPDVAPFAVVIKEYAPDSSGVFQDLTPSGGYGLRVVNGVIEDGISVNPVTLVGSWVALEPFSNLWR